MGHLRQSTIREARDPAFAMLLAAIGVSLIRAVNQPGFSVSLAGTSVRIVLGDLLLAALVVVIALRVTRTRAYPRSAAVLTVAALAFAALILATALANGSTAFVAAGKLVFLSALLVGCVVLIDSADRLWVVVLLIVIVTAAAVGWGLVGFAQNPGSRQASFLGEHDLAALSTACLIVALAALHCRHRLIPLPLVAGVVGCAGIMLGAALASLLSLYLAIAALIVIAAFARLAAPSLGRRSRCVVAVVLTGATYSLRAGDLGFLQQWFAPAEDAKPGQYAGSWSQRLIFVVHRWPDLPRPAGARNGLVGRASAVGVRTIPPGRPDTLSGPARPLLSAREWVVHPAADLRSGGVRARHRRHRAVRSLCSWSQPGTALRSARAWPRGDRDELAAYLAAPWLASLVGAIAGSALFGGTPMAALFWLTFGLVGASRVAGSDERPGRPHGCMTAARINGFDRARDRTAERRRSGVARHRARGPATCTRSRGRRRRRHPGGGRGVDGVRRPRSRRSCRPAAGTPA